MIVDLKRPTRHVSRVLTTFALHDPLAQGLHDLPTLLSDARFTGVEISETGFRVLGFVRGQTRR